MTAVPGLLLLATALGYAATAIAGPALSPPPAAVVLHLLGLAAGGDLFIEAARTLSRGALGILIANLLGVGAGLAAGCSTRLVRLARPALTALNACPPVVWISLAMVWMGTGGAVPTVAVVAGTLPPVFLATLEGVASQDPRLRAMSRAFAVPAPVRLARMVVPGVFPFWLAAFAHTSSAAWKLAAVAEYLGAADGLGARIYWAYRRLDMEGLYAWTAMVVAIGVLVDAGLIARLRRPVRSARRGEAAP
ncbi:MAG: ABC transporter permease subunit [Telmatospirillum sp.]|nr:ABC transporter permease subunit [Telmatospirillum sp.]